MTVTKRVLLVSNLMNAVLGPTPTTHLGLYTFVDDHPKPGDVIKWSNGKQYAVQGRMWDEVGDYCVLVHEVDGFEIPEKGDTNEAQV